MTSISKNVYIDKLDNIVNEYNDTYHSSIKMKPVDVKSSMYIDSTKENNKKDPRFNIGDIARISISNILENVTLQIGLKQILRLKMLQILCRRHMLLMILMEKKLLERFTRNNCKNQNIKKSLQLKKQ